MSLHDDEFREPLPRYVRDAAHADLLATEWLQTNGLAGFAMGTAMWTPTRRYHALLVAATQPPGGRVATVKTLVERVTLHPGTKDERVCDLSALQFFDTPYTPPGAAFLRSFERDSACRWHYQLNDENQSTLSRILSLDYGANTASIHHALRINVPFRLEVRPLLSMLDFHSLGQAQHSYSDLVYEVDSNGVRVSRDGRWLHLTSSHAAFHPDAQWWHQIYYAHEAERGLDHTEDLFSPGIFVLESSGQQLNTINRLEIGLASDGIPARGISQARRRHQLIENLDHIDFDESDERTRPIPALVVAADDFVVRRPDTGDVSVIAGYPWFSDWGRDTMICLPGLLLELGRYDDALHTLMRFARHRRNGIIPNRFDDRTGDAEYNTVDASLWFIQAACSWLTSTARLDAFHDELLPACRDIVDAYEQGTDYDIARDPADGLIAAGNESTQLTWMDAQRDGITYTPRHGKPVEINALWFSGLHRLALAAERAGSTADRERFDQLSGRNGTNSWLRQTFWRAFSISGGGLADRLERDTLGKWHRVPEIRPNQIFAVSLPETESLCMYREPIVEVVRDHLLTPHALRTLSPVDRNYHPRYRGALPELDSAYHTGTSWPWLLGPFVEASLRTGLATPEGARAMLQPTIDRLDGECPGQLAEVFDGDDTPEHPQQPGGCPAQAWSVAETLRVWLLTLRHQPALAHSTHA